LQHVQKVTKNFTQRCYGRVMKAIRNTCKSDNQQLQYFMQPHLIANIHGKERANIMAAHQR